MRQLVHVISYNLKNHKAVSELTTLAAGYAADILCLQECDTDKLPQTIGKLSFAGSTITSRLGLAIYYRSDRLSLQHIEAFPLKKSIHDRVLTPADERLLVADCTDTRSGVVFQIGCFHAAPLTASNSLRRKQIRKAHQLLTERKPNVPTVMLGDYNYPLFKRGLKRHVTKNGYELTLSDKPTYALARVIKGHFDFLTSNGVIVESVKTLPQGLSDHAPIVAKIAI